MNIENIQFDQPYWLWLLPIFMIYFIWWLNRHATNHAASIADIDISAQNHFYHPLADKLLATPKPKQKSNPSKSAWFQGVAITMLIIALAQPVIIGERLPDPPPERDIVFLVDTSVSMQLKDYELAGEPIRRMDLLHNLLDEFASKMQGERISVIVFASEPYILVPLTNDQTLIRRMLSRVTTGLTGRYTAVGDALLLALQEAKKQSNRHQTFILFTDIDDESLGKVAPIAAASLVAEHNIPIFTVAIGSSHQADPNSVSGGLYQGVNLPLLESIAKKTGGGSYQVHDSEAMQQAMQDILQQRRNLAKPKPLYEKESLYAYFLIIAVGILLLQQACASFKPCACTHE